MRGIEDFNFPRFFESAKFLRGKGWIVFNPAERDVAAYGADALKTATGSEEEVSRNLGMQGLTLARQCFAVDTNWICHHADAIALLPGWEKSKGAMAEYHLAVALGLEVIYL